MGATAPPPPSVEPNGPDATRKTVTALFCDLVGSTAFGETVDAESARETMARYRAMAGAAIERQGGTVAKFIGDGVMALFGVPEVSEDDADRAVAAGLDLQRGFEPIREVIAERYGTDLGLRVGINTGEVVIGGDDADVVGDALNTAARLEAACPPGGVLVGESTWRLTRATVGYEPLGSLDVKGKAEPVAAFRVEDRLADGDDRPPPFVGREGELALLQATFDEAVDDGGARLVTVIGSPGVGKTRLAAELARILGDRARTFDLRCERAGTTTFAPVVDLLHEAAGLDDSHSPEQINERIATLVADAGDADRVAPLLGGFVGSGPTRSTEEMFFAVRRLVEILGARQPVILVVDDIQWAEPMLLDLLEHLADWAQAAPALIIGLARPEIREVRPELAEPGRRVTHVISLEGLDPAATQQLAAELVGRRALPDELVARLPESTEGNPLFVRELMRMLVDDGVIVDAGANWSLAIDADAIEVPPTINSLLAARVERMSDTDRRVLELASVVGSEFALGAVRAVADPALAAELDSALEGLRRRELVEPTGGYWGNEPLYRFHHVLIRDAAYRRLLKGTRADLHRSVAEWTESTAVSLVGEHEVTIAYHYEQAHDYRRQLNLADDETDELGRRAAALLHTAATHALGRDDLAAAGSLAARAVACLADDDPTLPELMLVACEALLGAGAAVEGAPLVERLQGVASGDERLTAWADCYRAELTVLADPDGLREAEHLSDDAGHRLVRLGDQSGVAKARLVRATSLARLGRVGECEAELVHALSAARSIDDNRRVTAVLGAAPVAALWGPSPVPRAGGRCLDVIRLLRITTGSPAVEAVSVRCQAVLEALRGRFDTSRRMLDQARATAEELGLRRGLLETELYAGIVELLAGDPVAAEPHLRAARQGLGRLGIGADAGQAAAHLARSLMEQGRLDEAREMAEESATLAGQNPQTHIAAGAVRAEILAALGDVDTAVALAAETVELASGTDILVDHANVLAAQARVLEAAGDSVGAASAASAAALLYEAKGATVGEVVPVESAEALQAPATENEEWWNEPMRLAAGSIDAFLERDAETIAAGLAESIVYDDRRQVVRMVLEGRDAFVQNFTKAFDGLAPPDQLDVTPIAARGDDLALVGITLRNEEPITEMSWLSLGRYRDGLLDLVIAFDPEDLPAAIDELDRLHSERLPWSEALTIRGFALVNELIAEHDTRGLVELMHPDFELVDRRSVGWPTVGRAEYGARVRTLFDSVDEIQSVNEWFFRLNTTGAVYSHKHYVQRDETTLTQGHLLVTLTAGATGLPVRMEQFEDHDTAAALARFDELHASLAPLDRHPAVQTGGAINFMTVTARLHPGVLPSEGVAIETASGERITAVDLDGLRAAGFGGSDRRVIAVRGDLLALINIGMDDGTRRLSVEEIDDDDDRLVRIRHFEARDLVSALDHLDERWLELDGDKLPEVAGLLARFGHRARHGDEAGGTALLTDDCVSADRRPGGLGELTMQPFTALITTTETNDFVLFAEYFHRLDRHGAIVSARLVPKERDPAFEPVPALAVVTARDGLIDRIEHFHTDHLTAAEARFEELARALGVGASLAARSIAARVAAIRKGDLEAVDRGNAPTARAEDRRRLGRQDYDRELLLGDSRWLRGLESQVIGEWGARMVVTSNRLEHDGNLNEWYVAQRVDLDGRGERRIIVDTEEEALAALDELVAEEQRSLDLVNTMTMIFERMDDYADAEVLSIATDLIALMATPDGSFVVGSATPAAEIESLETFDDLEAASSHMLMTIVSSLDSIPAVFEALGEFVQAYEAVDLEALDRILANDLRVANARSFYADADDKAGVLEFLAHNGATLGTTYLRKRLAWTDHLALMWVVHDVREPDGSSNIVELLGLNQVRDGQLVRMEEWELDDLPAALARFDALAAAAVDLTHSSTPPVDRSVPARLAERARGVWS